MRKYRYISIALAVVMALSFLPPSMVASGSEPTPISTEQELAAITQTGNYVLANNIAITGAWSPLAGTFTGTLDGNGYTISGLPDALFSEINGTIKDLNLNVKINMAVPVDELDEKKASALSHNMGGGTVTNVNASGTIVINAARHTVAGLVAFMGGGFIDGCTSDVTINSVYSNSAVGGKGPSLAGGIVGMTWINSGGPYGAITNCSMTGSINVGTANEIRIGGIVAHYTIVGAGHGPFERNVSSVQIDVALSKKAYVGGLVGYFDNQAILDECAAIGVSISVNAENDSQVGGIAGYGEKDVCVYRCLSVNGRVATLGKGYAGAIAGGIWSGNAKALLDQFLSINNTVSANSGAAGLVIGYVSGPTVWVKSAFYDTTGTPGGAAVGHTSADAPARVNLIEVTPDQWSDRATFNYTGNDDTWLQTFDQTWIVPTGELPTLLWMARNIPSGIVIVDTDANGVADGNGFQSGYDIGVVGDDVFGSLEHAVLNAVAGKTIEFAAPLDEYSFDTQSGRNVLLNLNGGKIFTMTVPAANSILLPSPSKSGFNFSGWRAGSTTYQAGETVAIAESLVFNAQWTAISTYQPQPEPPQPETQTKTNADGSVTSSTVTTTTAADGTVTTNATETTTRSDGTVSTADSKTVVSQDGTTATTEQTKVVKDASGEVMSTVVTQSTTSTDMNTGISSTIGSTTATTGGSTSTTAFSEVKLDVASSSAISSEIGDALIAALKQNESTVAATGVSVQTVLKIGTSDNAKSVTLPLDVIATVANETSAAVVIAAAEGQIELSNAALAAISEAGDSAATLSISIASVEASDLPDAQSAVAAAGKAFVIEISATDSYGNVSVIHSLGSGEQIVRLPYTPSEGEDYKNLTVYYTDDSGVCHKIGGVYNAEDGYMEFRTNHNSLYLIVSEAVVKYSDVTLNNWFYGSVNYVVNRSIMNGMYDTEFMPSYKLTRAMLVTILYRLEGEPKAGVMDFHDVPAGQWYSNAIAWAKNFGMVNGFEDGTFRPNDDITREQMAAILYRYAAYREFDVAAAASIASFSDANTVSTDMVAAIQWAVAEGLINGMTPGTLEPRGTATRAQVAEILNRFCVNFGV